MIDIHPLRPQQWQLYKAIRTAALTEAPYAFSTTLSSVQSRTDADWQEITRHFTSEPNSLTYIAYEDQQPCGMAACVCQGWQAHMYAVWVDPAHRRRGVGLALIDFARQWARSQGATTLLVGLFDENLGALALYTAAGFEDRGQTEPGLYSTDRPGRQLTMDL